MMKRGQPGGSGLRAPEVRASTSLTVRPLPDWEMAGAAIKMQQTTGVSWLTGLPVVVIGPVWVKPTKAKR